MSHDVVILGAGFAGCATAWSLARRGVNVTVLEQEAELGRYASGRGAGLGRQLCEDDDTSALAIRGAALHREHFADAWSPTGGILTFEDASHANEYIARAKRLSVEHAVMKRDEVLARWPQLRELQIAAALHVPSDGVIDASRLLGALSNTRTRPVGMRIDLSRRVARIAHREGRVEIRTQPHIATTTAASLEESNLESVPLRLPGVSGATYWADVVVDATGAWAGALTGDAPLDSFKRHLFVIEAATSTNAPYLWHLGARELYLRTDGDGLLVSPCDADVTTAQDQQPSADADARLRARLAVAPDLVRAPIMRRWACQRAFAPDRKMRLGRDPQRQWLVWAAALGGHGATAAPAVGEVVADAVIDALRALS